MNKEARADACSLPCSSFIVPLDTFGAISKLTASSPCDSSALTSLPETRGDVLPLLSDPCRITAVLPGRAGRDRPLSRHRPDRSPVARTSRCRHRRRFGPTAAAGHRQLRPHRQGVGRRSTASWYVGCKGHADKVTALAYRPDGKVLASAGLDRAIRLWNAEHRQRPPRRPAQPANAVWRRWPLPPMAGFSPAPARAARSRSGTSCTAGCADAGGVAEAALCPGAVARRGTAARAGRGGRHRRVRPDNGETAVPAERPGGAPRAGLRSGVLAERRSAPLRRGRRHRARLGRGQRASNRPASTATPTPSIRSAFSGDGRRHRLGRRRWAGAGARRGQRPTSCTATASPARRCAPRSRPTAGSSAPAPRRTSCYLMELPRRVR